MIFSYYFNSEKTHLLNFRFRLLQQTEKEAGIIEMMFSAEMEEILNGRRRKRETRTGTFTFPPDDGGAKHDIDFSRIRDANQNKWIFTVINNKNTDQRLTTGIISETLDKNPIGFDIYLVNEDYDAELRANNLSMLDSNYIPPVLTQTIVSHTFNQPGHPEGFVSQTSSYLSGFQLYVAKEWKQTFSEKVPKESPFTVQMDLAPESVSPLVGNKIFDVYIDQVGTVSLYRNFIEFVFEGADPDIQRTYFDKPVALEDFWDHGFKAAARLTIQGDGEGNLTIRYNNHTINGWYNKNKSLSFVEYKGMTRQ